MEHLLGAGPAHRAGTLQHGGPPGLGHRPTPLPPLHWGPRIHAASAGPVRGGGSGRVVARAGLPPWAGGRCPRPPAARPGRASWGLAAGPHRPQPRPRQTRPQGPHGPPAPAWAGGEPTTGEGLPRAPWWVAAQHPSARRQPRSRSRPGHSEPAGAEGSRSGRGGIPEPSGQTPPGSPAGLPHALHSPPCLGTSGSIMRRTAILFHQNYQLNYPYKVNKWSGGSERNHF